MKSCSSIIEILRENRTQILLTEIGAYLHLLGRYSIEFIKANATDAKEDEKKYDYKKICRNENFFEGSELNKILSNPEWENYLNKFKSLSDLGELQQYKVKNFCEFIEKHTWGKGIRGLCRILADAHGIVSAIDKGLAGRGHRDKQKRKYTYRSSAFGYEKEIEFLESHNLDEVNIEKIRDRKKKFFDELQKLLQNILDTIRKGDDIKYEDYKHLKNLLKNYYSQTIGETRRPINEITLYDYTYTIASLLKSNLAKILIDGWYDPKGRSKWRILKINVDILGLMSKGLKIGDILGYKKEIDDLFERIKKVIEYEYPLGNEIYRDSTGIYFSCPDLENIEQLKKELIEKLKEKFGSVFSQIECSLQLNISEKGNRSIVILAKEIDDAYRELNYPHINNGNTHRYILNEDLYRDIKNLWRSGWELCPVCLLRPKSEKYDRCKVCRERYEKRAIMWIEENKKIEENKENNNKKKETIWLDEIADKNNNVALIILQFDLKKWLSGELIDTFIAQTFDNWKANLSKKVRNFLENNRKIKNLDDLKNYFKELFSGNITIERKDLEILKSFIYLEEKDLKKFDINKHFWDPIVERDATGKAQYLTDPEEKANHLIKLLFRKHPSFARIYRIWNTTQEFIDHTVLKMLSDYYERVSGIRRQRIQFRIKFTSNLKIRKGATCDIIVDGMTFSPVCVDENKNIFISTINLELLDKFGKSIEEICRNLNNKKIKVKVEGKGSLIEGEIIDVKPAEDKFQNYYPYTVIYSFPDQFMVLLPACDALDIAKKIVEEYKKQFSKVRDRLSFHIGIIAFHRKLPLHVVMDAGKRLLESFKKETKTKNAKILSINKKDDKKLVEMELEIEGEKSQTLKLEISYSTGDPEQDDIWHPYIRVSKASDDLTTRTLVFTFDEDKNINLVHVTELKEGDEIQIEPSYFKLCYLKDSSERFWVGEDLKNLDYIFLLDKLWNMIESKIKSKKWSLSQIYAYWEEVEKRKEYDSELKEMFIKDAITNFLDLTPNDELYDEIYQATITGALWDCLFWNLKVKKIFKEGVENV